MAPKLYSSEASPAVRGVLLTAKALGIELELKPVNLFTAEHLTPEYIKMNPQHTVPTLDDDGYILWDSHAIICYLSDKYGKTDALYPKDLKKRGLVDQRLFYNAGVIQPRFGAIVGSILREGATTISKEKQDQIEQIYDILEAFLEGKTYMAGETLTIADMTIAASVSTASAFIPFNDAKHSRLSAWLNRIQALPYYKEANQNGMELLVGFLKSKLA